jgi:two-component system sensor histidine kinase QseC
MSAPRIASLRTRLLAGTLAAVAAIWIALALFAWREARHESDELFDAHLAQTGALLAGLVGEGAAEIAEHLPSHRYARKVAVQVWAGGTRLLAHSAAAPDERLTQQDEGFSESQSGGRGWRVYSQWDAQRRYLVQVAETLDARRAVGREIASHLLAPLAIALPLLAVALVVLIRASLAPLSRLADSIGSRSPNRLDAIVLEEAPRELRPILAQLNRLFGRVADSLEQERRFTADAAHELRTPLAAMRTHAQVARASGDAAQRDHSLDRVVESVDRATHLVEQLLTLARLDAATLSGRFAPCELREVAAEALAQVAPLALAKAIEPALAESPRVEITGDRALLTVMLRNLIDNAVRYSPPETSVSVATGKTAEGDAQIEIVDQGPGIAPQERRRALDRFYRVAGGAESGSGLGLSIVARIAELHGARLELLDNPAGRGLRVRVVFPASRAIIRG